MDVLKNRYTITELSETLNITDHALRFYEKEFGLQIPKDQRGRRFYTTEHANLMFQIKTMRDQGLELKAIRKILQDENIVYEVAKNSATDDAHLPAVIVSAPPAPVNSSELTLVIDAINSLKDQLFLNLSNEIVASKEHLSKELLKTKLELGASFENSSRKLESKLDRHFQEFDRSITIWRERRNSSFSSKLKRIIGK